MKFLEIFWRFFILGFISFGGPAAHLAIFRKVFVEQKKWLSDEKYAQMIALSQFLPGPGSSQVGFSIGLNRAGLLGGLAAFIGFTLPSFLLMLGLAIGLGVIQDNITTLIIDALKLFAVIIVADAIWSMAKNFCKDITTQTLMIMMAAAILIAPSIGVTIILLLLIGVAGYFNAPQTGAPLIFKPNWFYLGAFLILLISLPLMVLIFPEAKIFSDFYLAGSLVFGGGHVVLPMLQGFLGNAVPPEQFMTAYAAAQAVPGPMFTLATYLGATIHTSLVLGAIIATIAIFLPGFLLILALQHSFLDLADHPRFKQAIIWVNASVVGLLIAALYNPIFISTINKPQQMAWVLIGLLLLRVFKWNVFSILALSLTIWFIF